MKRANHLKKLFSLAIVISFYIGLYLLSKEHFYQFKELSSQGVEIKILPIIIACILIAPNWLLESIKWQVSLRPVERVTFSTALKGVLRGIAPSLFTPNRVGEAIGRPSVLEDGNRISGALATGYCGISQMPIMILFGMLSCIYFSICNSKFISSTFLSNEWFVVLGFVCAILVTILFMLPEFFLPFVGTKAEGWRAKIGRHLIFFTNYTFCDRLQMLGISAMRYFVYSLQNYFTILTVGINIGFVDGMMSVFLIYLLISFVPRPALTELGVRCSASVFVLHDYIEDYTLPTLASILLWTINLLLPAICGAALYLFRNK